MRISLLLALTLASTSTATVTQAQESQTPNAQETQIPNQQISQKQLSGQSDSPLRRRSRPLGAPVSGIDSLIFQAEQAMRRMHYGQAASLFREILDQHPPNRHEFHVGLGAAMLYDSPLQRSRRFSRGDAIDQFERALRLKANYRPALRGLVQAYELQGDAYAFVGPRLARGNTDRNLDKAIENYQEAKNYFDQITRLNQGSPRIRERRVRYVRLRRLSSEPINSKLARAYMERGDQEKQKRFPSHEKMLEDYRAAFGSLGLSWRNSSQWIDSEDCRRLISWSHSPRTLANSSRGSRPRQIRRNERHRLLAGEIRNKLAIAYTEEGDRENSLDDKVSTYCRALRVNDTYASAHLKLGQALWRQGKQEVAIKYYERAIQVDNKYVEAYLILGEAFEAQGNQIKAGDIYVRLLKIAPDNPNLWSRLSNIQLENLVRHFRLKVFATKKAEDYYYLGYVLHWQRDYQGAIENYDKVISFRSNATTNGSGLRLGNDSGLRLRGSNPKRYDALRQRGRALSQLGNYEQAIESLNRAIRIRPSSAVGYYSLGEVLVSQGQDFEGAIASYSRAIEIDENYALAYNARGQVRVIQEDWRGARRDFLDAINSDREYAEPHNNIGKLYQYHKRFDQAIHHYIKALRKSDNNYPEASNNLAQARAQLENWLVTRDYKGPTCGNCDWFWLNRTDEYFEFNRSVVRIASEASGIGAGWVIKKEENRLWIVTNRHVVSGGGEIAVEFFSDVPPGRDYLKLPARLVEIANDNEPDLALLVVDNSPGDIKPLEVSPDPPRKNSEVFTIGHPNGIGNNWNLSPGSISNVKNTELQIDAPLASGNSGGPLINEDDRRVVGIVTNTAPSANDETATAGFGYAIPMSYLQDTLSSWGIAVPSR